MHCPAISKWKIFCRFDSGSPPPIWTWWISNDFHCFATAVLLHLNYFELVSLFFFQNLTLLRITCVSPRCSHHTIPWFRPTTSTNSFDSNEWRCSHSALAEVLHGPNCFYMLRSADTKNRQNKRCSVPIKRINVFKFHSKDLFPIRKNWNILKQHLLVSGTHEFVFWDPNKETYRLHRLSV